MKEQPTTNTPAADAVQMDPGTVNPVRIHPDNMAAIWQQYCRLAYHIARPYLHAYPAQADDIRQECYLAICSAVNTYDSKAGSFATYLPYHVRRIVGQYCRRNASAFSLPEHTNTGRQRLARAESALQAAGIATTERNVLLLSGISAQEYNTLAAAERARYAASLSDLIPGADGVTVADTIPDPHNGIDDAFERFAADDLRRNLDALLCYASDPERDMIRRYYYEGQTTAEIAEHYEVDPAAVRRKIGSALQKLRRRAQRSRAFEEYLNSETYTTALRGGLDGYLRTWESSTEKAAFNRLAMKQKQKRA